jgi:uncharacterized protein YbbC (DUF1343 family)
MEAAAGTGIRIVVLDRPNPLGGVSVEGPLLVSNHSVHFDPEGITDISRGSERSDDPRINVDATTPTPEGSQKPGGRAPNSGGLAKPRPPANISDPAGVPESPRLGYESFVGCHSVCTRHGMTIGELAQLYKAERKINIELQIIPCQGWRRTMLFPATGLTWVMPSPNMPTFDTALVYPGMCLIEGTNLSEGRGTTRPFEIVGFPGINSEKLANRLNALQLTGVYFRPVTFKPTFQKHAGQVCGGVQLHVTDAMQFQPVRTGLAVLIELRQAANDRFRWRAEMYEFVTNPIAIDLLFGSDRERKAVEAGVDWREIAVEWEAEEGEFRMRRQQFLMY